MEELQYTSVTDVHHRYSQGKTGKENRSFHDTMQKNRFGGGKEAMVLHLKKQASFVLVENMVYTDPCCKISE